MSDRPVVFLDANVIDLPRINELFADEPRAGGIEVSTDPDFRQSCDAYLWVVSMLHAEPKYPYLVKKYQVQTDSPLFWPVRLDTVGTSGEAYLGTNAFEPNVVTNFEKSIPRLVVLLLRAKAIEHLVESYRKGDLILYLGAGVSARSGYPVWGELTDCMLAWVKKGKLIRKNLLDSLEVSQEQGDYDDVAEAIATAPGVKRNQLLSFLRQQLHHKDIQPGNDLKRLLSHQKLSGVLTTNFDDLIDKALPKEQGLTLEAGEELLDRLSKRRFICGKLYGDLDHGLFMLSPNEFRDTVAKHPAFLDFMRALFVSRTLLFLGCSLNGIENYLDALPFRETSPRKHYALIGVTGTGWQTQSELLHRRYNIEVIPYSIDEGHAGYREFTELLNQRLEAVDQTTPVLEANGFRFNGITHITLENIGPHAKLELTLDPHWNVLLGDNGVGKTHILKAIALAACGKSGVAYAGRLLRSGTNKGRVHLQTADMQYELILERHNGKVDVKVLPGSLLEVSGTFILAFPPLRTANQPQVESGNGRRMQRPVVDDVLPVLAGDLDPRMERLKNWLIQLDHIISQQETDDLFKDRQRGLRDAFFEILSDLTQGVTFEFGRVDARAKQVYVVTDDGEIPSHQFVFY